MDERLRGAIVRAAEAAGRHLMNPNGSRKSPDDTEKRAREIMQREIKAADPMLARLGEGAVSERSVAICPLDSSMNYSRSFPFGVMAAYVEAGRPIFGALFLPLTMEMVVAEAGKGARLDGRRISVSGRRELRTSITCLACDCYMYDMGEAEPMALDSIAKLALGGMPWRNSGSPASDFCALALGKADAVISPILGQHAAGYLIMEEAGAVVSDMAGKPYSLSSDCVVAANRDLHGLLVDFLHDPTR